MPIISRHKYPSYPNIVLYSLTVLEGIALSSDPNYKVLSSSYPWIARKVLTDKSPKIRSTLQELVYKVSYISSFLWSNEHVVEPESNCCVPGLVPRLKDEER